MDSWITCLISHAYLYPLFICLFLALALLVNVYRVLFYFVLLINFYCYNYYLGLPLIRYVNAVYLDLKNIVVFSFYHAKCK